MLKESETPVTMEVVTKYSNSPTSAVFKSASLDQQDLLSCRDNNTEYFLYEKRSHIETFASFRAITSKPEPVDVVRNRICPPTHLAC
jgi:hypothetical protein